MATRDTLWTCVGITVHVGSGDKRVTKVRCGVDLARRIKSSKSKSYVKSRGEHLTEVRTDFIELPNPMLRVDALRFALSAPEFQDPADQALIQEAIAAREPKEPKRAPKDPATKTVRVRRTKSDAAPSLDTIKRRARKTDVTAEQVVAAALAADTTVTDTAVTADSAAGCTAE
jgi:hypothetical protein